MIISYKSNKRDPYCFNCGETGNISKSCRKISERIICFNCGKIGHASRLCPDINKKKYSVCLDAENGTYNEVIF